MSMWTEAEFILPEQYTAKQIEDEAEKLFDCVSVSAKGKLAYISIGELSLMEAIIAVLEPLSKRFGFTFYITGGHYYYDKRDKRKSK